MEACPEAMEIDCSDGQIQSQCKAGGYFRSILSLVALQLCHCCVFLKHPQIKLESAFGVCLWEVAEPKGAVGGRNGNNNPTERQHYLGNNQLTFSFFFSFFILSCLVVVANRNVSGCLDDG